MERTAAPVSPVRRAAPVGDRMVVVLFTLTSFLGASLLFAVQPMVTRMLLPSLGGSPAAWNTAMVFFQTSLLIGYVAAHVSIRALGLRRHVLVQIALLLAAAATLPIAVPSGWVAPASGGVELWTLVTLVLMAGAPFVVLSTTSPTLQRWLAGTDHPAAADPYFLYAAGNAGSLLALLSYPLLVDRVLGVRQQSAVGAIGFGLLIAMTALCGAVTRQRLTPVGPAATVGVGGPPLRWSNPRWIVAAAIPSALLLGTTRHLGTDVASVPLLWVIPLAIYLATFIVAFGGRAEQALRWGTTGTAVLALPALLAWFAANELHAWPFALHLAALASVALLAHGRLAVGRPPTSDLTGFYVALSVGGALGGATAALVAPVVFDQILEYPLALVAGVALIPRATASAGAVLRSRPMLVASAAVLLAGVILFDPLSAVLLAGACAFGGVLLRRMPLQFGALFAVMLLVLSFGHSRGALHAERTFFGVSRVEVDSADGTHVLVSGTTVHGSQVAVPDWDITPTTYYTQDGPAGQVILERQDAGPVTVGVVGLGAGALASYTRAVDQMVFYEIDPAVVRIAQDSSLFTYLAEAKGDVEVELGDGRLLIERGSRVHDILVVDAFSSDSIPVHLLTTEAVQTYRDALAPGGAVLIHISNRYFDLAPVVAAVAAEAGLEARTMTHHPPPGTLAAPSRWMVLAPPGHLPDVAHGPLSEAPTPGAPWTDDRSDLLGALRLVHL